jgi:hypothetical protein
MPFYYGAFLEKLLLCLVKLQKGSCYLFVTLRVSQISICTPDISDYSVKLETR